MVVKIVAQATSDSFVYPHQASTAFFTRDACIATISSVNRIQNFAMVLWILFLRNGRAVASQ